jgi:hypothetical protein
MKLNRMSSHLRMNALRAIALGSALFAASAGAQWFGPPDVEILNQSATLDGTSAIRLRTEAQRLNSLVQIPVAPAQDVISMKARISPAVRSNGGTLGAPILLTKTATINATTDAFAGRFSSLPPGTYTVSLSAVRTRLGAAAGNDQESTNAITIAQPAGCFNFTGGLEGWSANGLYDGDGNTVVEQVLQPFSFSNALYFAFTTSGGPATYQTDFVRQDLNSPSLLANQNWSSARGYSYQISSNIPMQSQPLFLVRRPDNSEVLWRELDANGSAVFYSHGPGAPAGGVAAQLALPADYTLIGMRLRVFVSPIYINTAVVASLDSVCPHR